MYPMRGMRLSLAKGLRGFFANSCPTGDIAEQVIIPVRFAPAPDPPEPAQCGGAGLTVRCVSRRFVARHRRPVVAGSLLLRDCYTDRLRGVTRALKQRRGVDHHVSRILHIIRFCQALSGNQERLGYGIDRMIEWQGMKKAVNAFQFSRRKSMERGSRVISGKGSEVVRSTGMQEFPHSHRAARVLARLLACEGFRLSRFPSERTARRFRATPEVDFPRPISQA